jgi:hypothetical protein
MLKAPGWKASQASPAGDGKRQLTSLQRDAPFQRLGGRYAIIAGQVLTASDASAIESGDRRHHN